MSMDRFDDLCFPDLIKTALINGYLADFTQLGMNIGDCFGEQIAKFDNFLSRVKDIETRAIFLEIGRPLFSESGSGWLINLGPDMGFFIKFLTEIKIERDGAHYALFLDEEVLARFKEELGKINDFNKVKKRLLAAFPHQQQKIDLLKKMSHNGNFEGVGLVSREWSLVLFDAGVRYRVGGTLKIRRADCNVMAILVSFNDNGYVSAAEYIYNNYAQDINDALQREVDLPWGKCARPFDLSKAKAIKDDAVEINLPRRREQRMRIAELLFMLKRTEEARSELRKMVAENPGLGSENILKDEILASLGLPEHAEVLETSLNRSLPLPQDLLLSDSKQKESSPLIVVSSPTANSVYLVNSGRHFEFRATDYDGSELPVKAEITDWLGASVSIYPMLPFPPRSGFYNLLISATNRLNKNTTLSIPFIIIDPKFGNVSGWGQVKFSQEKPSHAAEGANFGFLVKYDKGSISPNSYLDFSPFNLTYPSLIKQELKSTKIDWLIISENKAMFQGTGTINKQGRHNFRVLIECGNRVANQSSAFEITIWNTPSIEINPTHYRGILTKGKIEVNRN
ncbi:MAG: hypothetical protein QXX08_09495 [Candidatus Bathyarchaeia archaeon]